MPPLLGHWEKVPETRFHLPDAGTDSNNSWSYCITSKAAFLVPPEKRTMSFSDSSIKQGKFSFLVGPDVKLAGKKARANKTRILQLLKNRMAELKFVANENPPATKETDPEADAVHLLGGFGTPEHRKKVEKAAEEAVIEHYAAEGFSCTDVTKRNLGYDFVFTNNRIEHHVEVKGTSGESAHFFMTRNENAYRDKRTWRFAMVTNALSGSPRVQIFYNQQFTLAFKLVPYVFTGVCVSVSDTN